VSLVFESMKVTCPFYIIGDQLCLKLMASGDTEFYHTIYGNSQLTELMSLDINHKALRSSFRKSIRLNQLNQLNAKYQKVWVVEHRKSKRLIGLASIKNCDRKMHCAETGIILLPEWQDMRLGQEVKLLLLKFGFEGLRLLKINSLCDFRNKRMVHLNQKFGCKLIGVSDICPDLQLWQLDKKSYKQMNNK